MLAMARLWKIGYFIIYMTCAEASYVALLWLKGEKIK